MDERAYRRAVLEHKDCVFGYAARLLAHAEDARDVAQEALVRLWVHRAKVEEPAGARAWLLRTAHNLCLDRLRAGQPASGEALELSAIADARTASPEAKASHREMGEALAAALAKLSPRDRAVLLLRDVEGLAYEEIAQILEVPLGTLKAILHRARERARARLAADGVLP